jgi:hypothetical protein
MRAVGTPRVVLALGAAVVGALALRQLSLVPVGTPQSESALLRLSLSAQPERLERCRRLSDEEFNARPEHMRLRWECEGVTARYGLRVRVNDSTIATDTLRGAGLRHDRPIHTLREYPLLPGPLRVVIDVVRLDSSTPPPMADAEDAALPDSQRPLSRESREQGERRRRMLSALPPRLVLDTSIVLGSSRAALVLYDPAHRALRLRTSAAEGSDR